MARPSPSPAKARRAALTLAALLAGTGLSHFVVTNQYERIVPRVLGAASVRPLVLVTGGVELVIGALVAIPATRRVGAVSAAGLFVLMFPANVQMALDGGLAGAGFPLGSPLVSWLRLPLQAVLVWWALSLDRN